MENAVWTAENGAAQGQGNKSEIRTRWTCHLLLRHYQDLSMENPARRLLGRWITENDRAGVAACQPRFPMKGKTHENRIGGRRSLLLFANGNNHQRTLRRT